MTAAICGSIVLAHQIAQIGDRRWWLVIVVVIASWITLFWYALRDRQITKGIEAELREAGIDIPDEDPIRIKLAENRESLVTSLLALAIIAATFVAYFAGWIGSR
jgi:hypothetical protein